MVALVQNDVPIRLGRFRGGSLVGSKYVVTAAHCLFNPYPTPIQPEDLKVVLSCQVYVHYFILSFRFLRLG